MPSYTTTENKAWDESGLPTATRDYLANGAAVGNRDNALFAAACQFRDSGYSQAEAESRLIVRAVADGLSEAVA
jgi:Primase C terminal 1 (PriCT-1)